MRKIPRARVSGPRAILITGPGGAGKTTLAEYIGARRGAHVLSEDSYWAELKRGHPEDEWRTEDEELVIQKQVIEEALARLAHGESVAIEFILYCDPPRPLIAYHGALSPVVPTLVLALNPSAEAIWSRKRLRGRAIEQNIALESENAARQSDCLLGKGIDPAWRVDESGLSVEQLYDRYVAPFLDR